MIDTWEKFQNIIREFHLELEENGKKLRHITPKRNTCLKTDKPIDVYTGKTWDVEFDENNDRYYLYFGQGENFPDDKVGIAWLLDEHTTLFFERPFQNRPLKILQRLLPNSKITYDKNDIMIDGKKVGPSLPTGYGKREGHKVIVNDGIKVTTTIVPQSDPNTGHIYCLRWDNLDGLNERFKNSAHHQERLSTKAGLTTLADHLTISKEEFEKMLME